MITYSTKRLRSRWQNAHPSTCGEDPTHNFPKLRVLSAEGWESVSRLPGLWAFIVIVCIPSSLSLRIQGCASIVPGSLMVPEPRKGQRLRIPKRSPPLQICSINTSDLLRLAQYKIFWADKNNPFMTTLSESTHFPSFLDLLSDTTNPRIYLHFNRSLPRQRVVFVKHLGIPGAL